MRIWTFNRVFLSKSQKDPDVRTDSGSEHYWTQDLPVMVFIQKHYRKNMKASRGAGPSERHGKQEEETSILPMTSS